MESYRRSYVNKTPELNCDMESPVNARLTCGYSWEGQMDAVLESSKTSIVVEGKLEDLVAFKLLVQRGQ